MTLKLSDIHQLVVQYTELGASINPHFTLFTRRKYFILGVRRGAARRGDEITGLARRSGWKASARMRMRTRMSTRWDERRRRRRRRRRRWGQRRQRCNDCAVTQPSNDRVSPSRTIWAEKQPKQLTSIRTYLRVTSTLPKFYSVAAPNKRKIK